MAGEDRYMGSAKTVPQYNGKTTGFVPSNVHYDRIVVVSTATGNELDRATLT